jgi:hypothetical protein
MRVFVDQDDGKEPTEFVYTNSEEDTEGVRVDCYHVDLFEENNEDARFRVIGKDIPKLIKALEAAYEQITKENNL